MDASPRPGLLQDPAFGELRDYIVQLTGMDYYRQRQPDLAYRLARRLDALGGDDCAAYLGRLRRGGEDRALRDVADLLAIGETYFFRHAEQLEALLDLALPERLERNRDRRTLRIWSAGCATGAEPYTLALLLHRRYGAVLADWDVTLVGTDISQRFLDTARQAVYPPYAMRRVPRQVQAECFRRVAGGWELLPAHRHGVSFRIHNLARHPVPCALSGLSCFDIILCRNVAIYFAPPLAARLAAGFHRALVDGGWLALGHAEAGIFPLAGFHTHQTRQATLYQKLDGRPGGVPVPAWPGQAAVERPAAPAMAPAPATAPTVALPASPPSSGRAAPQPAGIVDGVRDLADGGQWLPALRACEQADGLQRLDPRLQLCRSLVLDGLGRHAEAIEAARRAVYLDRRDPLAHYWLAVLAGADRAFARRSLANTLDLLAGREDDDLLDPRDGLCVAHLRDLAALHLEAIAGDG